MRSPDPPHPTDVFLPRLNQPERWRELVQQCVAQGPSVDGPAIEASLAAQGPQQPASAFALDAQWGTFVNHVSTPHRLAQS